jgi:hypothetical protein
MHCFAKFPDSVTLSINPDAAVRFSLQSVSRAGKTRFVYVSNDPSQSGAPKLSSSGIHYDIEHGRVVITDQCSRGFENLVNFVRLAIATR